MNNIAYNFGRMLSIEIIPILFGLWLGWWIFFGRNKKDRKGRKRRLFGIVEDE